MVLTQRQFCSPGTCGNVRRHFRLSPWGKGVTGIQQVDPRDAAQHPELHGTVPTTKNSLVPNVLLLRFYVFIFRERGREGEREGEKHQCVVASRAPPTGDLAHNPGMCPDCELNQQPFGSQACEPKGHQFDSQSGHMPGLWARSPVEGVSSNLCKFLSPQFYLTLII